jgi:hypothetical protein
MLDYTKLNLHNLEPYQGEYIYTIINNIVENCDIITCTEFERDYLNNNDDLEQRIADSLSNNKTVIWMGDEEGLYVHDHEVLVETFNKFKNDNFFYITEFYKHDHLNEMYGLDCKVIHIPWQFLNQIICYDQLKIPLNTKAGNDYSFINLNNKLRKHRYELISELHKKDLAQYGFISLTNERDLELFANFKNLNVKLNDEPYIDRVAPGFPKDYPFERGRQFEDGLLVSGNVTNFKMLQNQYYDIPLVINTESYISSYFNTATEKSSWPILLGKMFLIYGDPGIMQWIQQFYDIDMSKYLDLTFDTNTENRLSRMLEDNRDIIINSKHVFFELRKDIHNARYTFVENLYQYFLNQLDKLQE